MKTIKRFLVVITTCLLVLAVTESCKKTATPKKLDGKWKAVKGSSTSTEMNDYQCGSGCTYNETETLTFDGTTWTGTKNVKNTQDNGTVTLDTTYSISNSETMSLSFDKKNGTFEQSFTSTDTDKNQYWWSVYDDTSCGSIKYFGGALDQKDVTTSTGTVKGDFQVTGGLGDTDKKSQFILFWTSWTDSWTSTYTYFLTDTDSSVNVTDLYIRDWSNNGICIKVPTSDSDTDASTGESSDGDVWTVTENKKGTMTMNQTYNYTDSDGSYSSSGTEEITLDKE